MQTALLRGICFNAEDVASAGPSQRLRSDALAVALSAATAIAKADAPSFDCDAEVCVVDPNVAFLMVRMGRIGLGPVDLLRKASLICVPIANFDTDMPEGGYHWTMVFLQKKKKNRKMEGTGAHKAELDAVDGGTTSSSSSPPQAASSSPGNRREEQHDDDDGEEWYPPLHVDSATMSQGSGGGGSYSSNAKFATRAMRIVLDGLGAKRIVTCAAAEPSQPYTKPVPVLCATSPRQHNSYDCGIFAALAVLDALRWMAGAPQLGGEAPSEKSKNQLDRVPDPIFLKCERDGAWSFNQQAASQFRGQIFSEMKTAFAKQN